MSFDLAQEEISQRLNSMPTTTSIEPSVWDGFVRGTGMATMKGFAKAGRAIDLLGSVGPIAQDAFTGGTVAQDRYFKEHDELFQRAVDYWTARPGEVGIAGEVVGGLLSMLPQIFASPSFAVASQYLGIAEDVLQKGATPGKASAAGAVQAVGLGLGIWVPILGRTLFERVVVGGAGFNVVQGTVTRGATGKVLEGTPAAEDFKAFDPTQLTLDVLLGLAFGSWAHLSPAQRAQGAAAWGKIADWTQTFKPSDIDAIATLRQAQHKNADSLPGIPAGIEDVDAHVARVNRALDQLARDEPVDVQDIRVPVEITDRRQADTGGTQRTAAADRRQDLAGRIDRSLELMQQAEATSRALAADLSRARDAGTDTAELAAQWKEARESIGKHLQDIQSTRAQLEMHRATTGQDQPEIEPTFLPDPVKVDEANTQLRSLQEEAARIQTEEGLQFEQPLRGKVYDVITEQLKATGRYAEKDIHPNAALVESFYTAMARRTGMTPEDMLAKYPLKITTEGPTGEAMDQTVRSFKNLTVEEAEMLSLADLDQAIAYYSARAPMDTRGSGYKSDADIMLEFLEDLRDSRKESKSYSRLDQTQTPAFKAWFGDSKVVDAEGKPLVVYRGDSVSPDVTVVKGGTSVGDLGRGIYLAESWDVAEQFTDGSDKNHVASLYAKISNPFDLTDRNLVNSPAWAAMVDTVANNKSKALLSKWARGDLDVRDTYGFLSRVFGQDPATFNAFLAEHGFDGVIDQGVRGLAEGSKQYVAFRPEQIKSAIGNSGKFDPNNPNILFQSGEPFYSELTRQVDALKMGQAPAKGWKDTIKGMVASGKVKQAEIDATQLNEWLDVRAEQGGKVTKDEVSAYLAGHGLKVVDVMLGGSVEKTMGDATQPEMREPSDASVSEKVFDLAQEGYTVTNVEQPGMWVIRDNRTGHVFSEPGDANQHFVTGNLRDLIDETLIYLNASPAALPTHFGQWQLPGGKNYREAFITLPETRKQGMPAGYRIERMAADTNAIAALTKEWNKFREEKGIPEVSADEVPKATWNRLSESDQARIYDFRDRFETVANTVGKAHFTLVGPDGIGTIMPEARTMDEAEAHAIEYFQRVDILPKPPRWHDGHSNYDDIKNPIMRYRFNERTDAEGKRVMFLEEVQPPVKAEFAKMPDYLQKNWLQMGMKRVITYAAQNGFDRVAWTTGEQQVLRYESALREHVDAIEWTKTPEGVQLVGYKGGPKNPEMLDVWNNQLRTAKEELIAAERQLLGNPKIFRKLLGGTPKTIDDPAAISDVIGGMLEAEELQGAKLLNYRGGWILQNADKTYSVIAPQYDEIFPKNALAAAERALWMNHTAMEYPELSQGNPDAVLYIAATERISGLTDKIRKAAKGREKVVDTRYKEDELSDAIGKAMADQIRNDTAQTGTIEGENITISKTGMAGLYDRQLPSVVNKIIGKMGGKVGSIEIGIEPTTAGGQLKIPGAGKQPATQQAIDITPELKAKALAGMPLFQKGAEGPRGYFQAGENGPKIGLLAAADKSTFLHESGHFFLDVTADLAMAKDAPAELRADMDNVLKWMKIGEEVPRGKQTVQMRKSEARWAENLPGMPRNVYAELAEIPQPKRGSEAEGQLQELRRRISQEGQTPQEALRGVFGPEGADAPLGLFEAIERGLAMPDASPETASRGAIWAKMTLDERRPYHEQFARGFEKFLAEGNAPTPELRGVFERFKAWLIDVYKTLQNLNVKLSPDIRGVMARMLGGDLISPDLPKAEAETPSRILADIRELGGIKQDEMLDITGERRAGKGVKGIPLGLFKTDGKGLDDLATTLRDRGWPIPADDVDGGVQALREIIRSELEGGKTQRLGEEGQTPGQQREMGAQEIFDRYAEMETQLAEKHGFDDTDPTYRAELKRIQTQRDYEMADALSAEGLRPEAEARRMVAENGDQVLEVGRNADGTPIRKTVRQYLDDADAEARVIEQDEPLLAITAECMMGVD